MDWIDRIDSSFYRRSTVGVKGEEGTTDVLELDGRKSVEKFSTRSNGHPFQFGIPGPICRHSSAPLGVRDVNVHLMFISRTTD